MEIRSEQSGLLEHSRIWTAQEYQAVNDVMCMESMIVPCCPQGLAVPNRVTVGWFETQQPQLFQPERCPAFLLSDERNGLPYYGFPEFAGQPGGLLLCFAATPSCHLWMHDVTV